MNLQFLLVEIFWKMAKVHVSICRVEIYTCQNYNRRETIEKNISVIILLVNNASDLLVRQTIKML